MGIDSMRVSGGRCPPIVVVGLLIACLMLSFNWWTLSAENFEFVRQIDELNEQLKISTEERDQCIILRENLDQKYKHAEDEVGSLHVQLDKLNEIKKKNSELEESLTICKSELDSIKKLDASKNIALESWKVEKESLNSKLDAKQEEIQNLQDQLDQVTKELESLRLSHNAPSAKEKEQLNLKPADTNLEPKINGTISKAGLTNVETSKDIENHGDDGINEEEEMEERERQMKGTDTIEKIDETIK